MSELVTWNTLESLCSLYLAKDVEINLRVAQVSNPENTICVDMFRGKIQITRPNEAEIVWRGLVDAFGSEQAKEALKAIHETQPSFE